MENIDRDRSISVDSSPLRLEGQENLVASCALVLGSSCATVSVGESRECPTFPQGKRDNESRFALIGFSVSNLSLPGLVWSPSNHRNLPNLLQ
jgi:hypothetical protein